MKHPSVIKHVNRNTQKPTDRRQNIIGFESNLNEIDPNIKHIWLKNQPKTCKEITLTANQ